MKRYNTQTPWKEHLPFKQPRTTSIFSFRYQSCIKRGPPVFFHSDTNPVFGNVLVHSVSKAHLLDVTGDMIWLLFLNILSFNFVFRLTVFVLANHCQSFNAFLLDVRCLKPCVNHVSFFLQLFLPIILHLRNIVSYAHLLLKYYE